LPRGVLRDVCRGVRTTPPRRLASGGAAGCLPRCPDDAAAQARPKALSTRLSERILAPVIAADLEVVGLNATAQMILTHEVLPLGWYNPLGPGFGACELAMPPLRAGGGGEALEAGG